jgi:endoglucanase
MNWLQLRLLSFGAVACASFSLGCQALATRDAPEAPGDPLCARRNIVIEDGENRDNQVIRQADRNGYMYTFADDAGTTVTPTAGKLGGTFSMDEGGASGSAYAARFRGKIAQGDRVYAGFGINFVDPKAPYDASRHDGISFYARRSKGSAASVRLKVPDANTTPEGKRCSECFNDFGTDLMLSEQWQPFVVPFAKMQQLPGWGAPRPGMIDARTIFGLQWQVNQQGANYDIWIDDVSFVGCGG